MDEYTQRGAEVFAQLKAKWRDSQSSPDRGYVPHGIRLSGADSAFCCGLFQEGKKDQEGPCSEH